MKHVVLQVVDNRICAICGARQGRCEHTKGEIFISTIKRTIGANNAGAAVQRKWSADEKAQLKKLWHGGLSTARIADILNVSEGAVAGQINRLHLCGEKGRFANA